MTLTKYLLLFILILFVITVRLVIDGIRTKNWKKIVLPIAAFLAVVWLIYYMLGLFLSRM